MNIVIDLETILDFFSLPIHIFIVRLFFLVGWIPISIVLLWGFKEMWVYYIQKKWSRSQPFVFLAIDIPRGNQQSPKAVENIFSYLAGAHITLNLIEKYWEGRVQQAFSLEIVSIDGYTQFVIHTPVHSIDLVESAIYAQYPDAEITEINDYTLGMPTHFPDDKYDIWGGEFIQTRHWAYPIKVYEEFEHQLGDPEVTYRDPMAALMDLTSSLKKGEQLWYQIIIMPIGFDWPEEGEKAINEAIGKKEKSSKTGSDKIVDAILKVMHHASEAIYTLWGDIEDKKDEEDDKFKMMNLTPKEKHMAEAMTQKISKIAFETKIRVLYMARKDVMNKPKVAFGFIGYMKQFASTYLNNLKPDMKKTVTTADYFFKQERLLVKKNKLIRNYIKRDKTAGRKRGLLNIEELATIWHFPYEPTVKAPLIQKAARRKAEPPMGLPISEEISEDELSGGFFEQEIMSDSKKEKPRIDEDIFVDNYEEKKEEKDKPEGSAPPNLPFV